jgi:hypothetical protein
MYYDFARNSSAAFVTSAMLVGMELARREGIGPDAPLMDRAIAHLKRVRLGDANFTYRTGVRLPIEGNAARGPLCELALAMVGQGNPDSLRMAVDNFFKYRHIIQKIKGQRGTHVGQGRTAPYYYLYGHYWVSRSTGRSATRTSRASATRSRPTSSPTGPSPTGRASGTTRSAGRRWGRCACTRS